MLDLLCSGHFGSWCTDYAAISAVVDATHRYKEIFYGDSAQWLVDSRANMNLDGYSKEHVKEETLFDDSGWWRLVTPKINSDIARWDIENGRLLPTLSHPYDVSTAFLHMATKIAYCLSDLPLYVPLIRCLSSFTDGVISILRLYISCTFQYADRLYGIYTPTWFSAIFPKTSPPCITHTQTNKHRSVQSKTATPWLPTILVDVEAQSRSPDMLTLHYQVIKLACYNG